MCADVPWSAGLLKRTFDKHRAHFLFPLPRPKVTEAMARCCKGLCYGEK